MTAEFSGEPRTVWLSHQGSDRKMKLLEPFWFRDRQGKLWRAGEEATIDGASIPRPLWTLVGSPYTGEYRRATIVHDVACVAATSDADRKRADKMFYEACRAGGCSWWYAVLLYVGVRIGAWYGSALVENQAPKLSRDALDEQVEQDFRAIAQLVLDQGEADDADVVEARTEAAVQFVAARRELAAGALPVAAAKFA